MKRCIPLTYYIYVAVATDTWLCLAQRLETRAKTYRLALSKSKTNDEFLCSNAYQKLKGWFVTLKYTILQLSLLAVVSM